MIMCRLRILNIKAGLREDFEKKPFYIKDVVLCLGHMYKPFQTIKIGLDVQGGGVREGQNMPKKWPKSCLGALPNKPSFC